MFSGIVEAMSPVIHVENQGSTVRLTVARPVDFNDIQTGDSIANNGVCLTVESFDSQSIQFALGLETLQVTGWTVLTLQDQFINLERSLRLGDRLHGHMVSGHVETMATLQRMESSSSSWVLEFAVDRLNRQLIWHKGSITLNGVSLTVNRVTSTNVEVCLIPETLERTNLARLKIGDRVTVEYDLFAKAVVNYQENKMAEGNI